MATSCCPANQDSRRYRAPPFYFLRAEARAESIGNSCRPRCTASPYQNGHSQSRPGSGAQERVFMRTLDWIVLFAWLASLVSYGLYRGRGSSTVNKYLLAGKTMPWYAMGLSILATQ